MRGVFVTLALLMTHAVITQTEELPPPAVEVIKTLEQELDQIRSKTEIEMTAKREAAIPKLKEIQDKYTRDAKLDDAIAIRDIIRSLKNPAPLVPPLVPPAVENQFQNRRMLIMGGMPGAPLPQALPNQNPGAIAVEAEELPPPAADAIKKMEHESELMRSKMETEIAAKREATIRKLQEIQDSYTQDAKLDEAVAIRDAIRSLKAAGLRSLPDPGNLVQYRGQNGKVMIFEVTGVMNGSIYGTDIYTDDSSLSAAAVHAKILKPGQKGVVKVTILPGQESYLGTQRNGLISSSYAQYPGSFKVQSLFGGIRPAAEVAPAEGQEIKALPEF